MYIWGEREREGYIYLIYMSSAHFIRTSRLISFETFGLAEPSESCESFEPFKKTSAHACMGLFGWFALFERSAWCEWLEW